MASVVVDVLQESMLRNNENNNENQSTPAFDKGEAKFWKKIARKSMRVKTDATRARIILVLTAIRYRVFFGHKPQMERYFILRDLNEMKSTN